MLFWSYFVCIRGTVSEIYTRLTTPNYLECVFLILQLRRDLISMLAPIDGIFSHDEIHTCPLNAIIGSVELEGDVDLDLIRETMRTNVLEARTESNKLLYPELGWTIEHWLGFPFWKEASLFLHDRIWLHPSSELKLSKKCPKMSGSIPRCCVPI